LVATSFRVVLHSGYPEASQELAEAAALHDHRLSAVSQGSISPRPSRFRLVLLQLSGVGALGIRAAGDEGAELADLDAASAIRSDRRPRRLDALPLEVLHFLTRRAEILLELSIEVLERLDVAVLPCPIFRDPPRGFRV